MNTAIIVLLTLAVVGIVVPAAAKPGVAPGPADCEITTSTDAISVGEDTYLVVDLSGVWIYEESNPMEGLQRDDRGHDDTCHGRIPADSRVL